ncbi:putative reverse transcriptase domain-containing protein [Tanacetum coccineum]
MKTRYFLSIVDDYLRRVWVHFLRHKNDVLASSRSEVVGGKQDSGIARYLIVSGSPQQNGLAERMNMTLLNKVRCLLIQFGFPYSLWAKATVMAAYLINRTPSKTLEKKTLMDLCGRNRLEGFSEYLFILIDQSNLNGHASSPLFGGLFQSILFSIKSSDSHIFPLRFNVFTDHKSLQHILDQKELNMRQRRWLELLSDYDCYIRYHPGKANVISDALSRKERESPLRVRALVVTISLDLPKQILNAQAEAKSDPISQSSMELQERS